MNAADAMVHALENEGVKYIFGVPGEENLDLLDAIRRSNIRFVVTRHEQSAGFMAATMGRLTGEAGVCLSTVGPGATNLTTPAAYALLGGMPLLLITGQKPILKSKQGSFQIVDTVELMRPLTKFTKQIVHGSAVPSLVREAFRIAEEERPGSVHLELPEDIAAEEHDVRPYPALRVRRPVAEAKAITWATEMIAKAKHPLLLIGAGANRKLTSTALLAFIEKTGIPFFTTQMGKGVVDDRHPLCLGTAALSDNDYLHCAIRRADLIINVGHDVREKPPFIMQRGGTEVIHVNFYSAKVDDVYFPQLEVVGDIAGSMSLLRAAVERQSHWDFSYAMKIKSLLDAHIRERQDAESFPVLPQRLVAAVRKAMPEDGVVALDNGMYKLWFARNYPAFAPNTLLLDNALATMGAGLPSAIAAKLALPDRRVMAVVGDGGFMMTACDLETAVRLKLDLTVVVLNDNGFGMIKWKQDGMQLPSFGLDYGNPDFVKFAESFGAKGHRVNDTKSLPDILDRCGREPGVHVVEVPVDYSENSRVLGKELKEKTCPL